MNMKIVSSILFALVIVSSLQAQTNVIGDNGTGCRCPGGGMGIAGKGTTVTFSSWAAADFPGTTDQRLRSCHWYHNGILLPYTNTMSTCVWLPDGNWYIQYTITNVQPADAGTYSVTTTNSGRPWTNTFTLYVGEISKIAGNCRSLKLGPASGYDPNYGSVTAYFVTSGHVTDCASDCGNGELQPIAGQPGKYQADFWINSDYGMLEYGRIVVSLPTTDSDGNGLPDVSQLSMGVNSSFNGTAYRVWPNAYTDTFTGTLVRGAGQIAGSYALRLASGYALSGTTWVLTTSGIAAYTRGSTNMMTLQISPWEPLVNTWVLYGITAFTVNNANQIAFPQFSVGSTYTVMAGVANRVGHRYAGSFPLLDGSIYSTWSDYAGWVFEITDDNDIDGNGIPDLSDVLPVPPAIIVQPQSQSVKSGTPTTFSVLATGTSPLHYQWMHEGVSISGATATNLILSAPKITNAGNYSVIVSNSISTAVSKIAVLYVDSPLHLANVQTSTNGHYQFQIIGRPSTNYIVQTSSNLSSWLPLSTNKSTTGIITFVDPGALTAKHLFFRAKAK